VGTAGSDPRTDEHGFRPDGSNSLSVWTIRKGNFMNEKG
jgi:hypothetical protein